MPVYNVNTLPDEADRFVFDTNVLLYLHGYTETYKSKDRDRAIREYSIIANNIIQEKSKVYMDITALSEFVNVYINEALAYKLKEDPKTFKFRKKDHRDTPEYIEVLEELDSVLKQILSSYDMTIIKDVHDCFDIGGAINALRVMEFNDHLISLSAQKHDLYLVTNDSDIVYNSEHLKVVTALSF